MKPPGCRVFSRGKALDMAARAFLLPEEIFHNVCRGTTTCILFIFLSLSDAPIRVPLAQRHLRCSMLPGFFVIWHRLFLHMRGKYFEPLFICKPDGFAAAIAGITWLRGEPRT